MLMIAGRLWPGLVPGILFLMLHSSICTAQSPRPAMLMPAAATSLLLDIASAGARLVTVGERGHILYSDNEGESWRQVLVPTSVMLTRLFFISDQQGWAVGHDGNIVMTRDGGLNWELQRYGTAEQIHINQQRLARAKLALTRLQRAIPEIGAVTFADTVADTTAETGAETSAEASSQLQQQLAAAQWAYDSAREATQQPAYAPPLMDVWFAGDTMGWAAGAYGSLLRTVNGGRSWEDWSHKLGNSDELHLNGVLGAADGALYLASEWGSVFRSVSAGETWQRLETGYEGSFFGLLENPLSGSLFAYGLRGTIYRSRDRGDSWEQLDSHALASLFGGVVTSAGELFFVGRGGTVVSTSDDGEHFEVLTQADRRGIFGVALLQGQEIFASGEGGSRRVLRRSTGQVLQ